MGQDPTKGGLILNLDGWSGAGVSAGGSSEVRFIVPATCVDLLEKRRELCNFICRPFFRFRSSHLFPFRHGSSRSEYFVSRRTCRVFRAFDKGIFP